MNRLTLEKRATIVRLLVEGMSVNSCVRTTGVSKVTILRLLVDLGAACAAYQYEHLVNLSTKFVQADEVWSFVAMKDKNVPQEKRGQYGVGDVWTWTAMDAQTKLIFSWHVGLRTPHDAENFMLDVAGRVDGRFQLTTDQYKPYFYAVIEAFGSGGVDYAQIVKSYGLDPNAERTYSPSICTGCTKNVRLGDPHLDKISTSHVKRTNLTLRMGNRRFTRLTNAHSKKIDNHEASIALHLMYYNFARPHETLTRATGRTKTTPAMASGITVRVWSLSDIVGLLD